MRRDKPYSIEFNLSKVQSVGASGVQKRFDFLLSLRLENFTEVLTCFSGDSEAITHGICDTQDQMPYGW